METLRKTIDQFNQFSEECIVKYCLLMNNQRILTEMANYIKDIAKTYNEEAAESKLEPTVTTKYGRLIKKPIKLDL